MENLIEKLGAQYAVLNGVRIRYVAMGSGDPVLLLHGFGECAETWIFSLENLSKHFKVYAVDLPGHGLSDKPKIAYSLPAAAEFIDHFMQKMGLERASIVGHSLGGIIGLHLAAHSPEKIERLVLVDTMGLNNRASLIYRLCALPGVGEIVMKPTVKAGLRNGMKRAFYNPDFITDEMVELNYKYLKMPGAKRVMLSILRNALDLRGPRREVIMTDRLPTIKHPTLFIHGRQDRTIPLIQAEDACHMMPAATLKIIEECGHCPHMEKADEFCKEVIEFLNSK